MEKFDDTMKKKLADRKRAYLTEIKHIKENLSFNYIAFILAKRWNAEYRTTGQKATYTIREKGGMVKIYLGEDQNVSKDFNLFLEENRQIIENQTKGEVDIRTDSSTVDYVWTKSWDVTFSIWVYFGGSNCERVRVGSETTTITKDIYEMVCH